MTQVSQPGRHKLYVIFNCGGTPDVHPIQDPARLSWEPVIAVEQYSVAAGVVLEAASSLGD